MLLKLNEIWKELNKIRERASKENENKIENVKKKNNLK